MEELCEKISRKFLGDDGALKSDQKSAIEALCEGKDVFVASSTGSGKSLIYQSVPFLNLRGRNVNVFDVEDFNPTTDTDMDERRRTVLVIAPLLTIMEEQVEKLNILNYKAVIWNDKSKTDDLADYDFIFASPEVVVGKTECRNLLLSKKFKLALIVVDEAHTVLNWATAENPFREWFGRIGELRSLVPTVQMLALTATAGPSKRRKIMSSLAMDKKQTCVFVSTPDRPNITLHIKVHSASQNISTTFSWLLDGLKNQDILFPYHIVFCKRMQDCGDLHNLFKREGISNELFNMYHSKTKKHVQDMIRMDMDIDEGKIRVLFCTNAAGMGVNFKGVHHVLHFGPPVDMDTFIQQLGRAGRDGGESHHFLLYNKRQRIHCESEMVRYTKIETCLREYLMECYSARQFTKPSPDHLCCDNCAKSCSCGDCPLYSALEDAGLSESLDEDNPVQKRSVDEDDKELLMEYLAEYRKHLAGEGFDLVSEDYIHGFSSGLVQQIVDKCDSIFTLSD